MDKILLASIFIFTIAICLFIGYWLGTMENFYQESRQAIWDWCKDTNNFEVCLSECNYFDEQCLKKAFFPVSKPLTLLLRSNM